MNLLDSKPHNKLYNVLACEDVVELFSILDFYTLT